MCSCEWYEQQEKPKHIDYKFYRKGRTEEHKPTKHTHTHICLATADLARPGTTKHQSVRSVLDQWVQGAESKAEHTKH